MLVMVQAHAAGLTVMICNIFCVWFFQVRENAPSRISGECCGYFAVAEFSAGCSSGVGALHTPQLCEIIQIQREWADTIVPNSSSSSSSFSGGGGGGDVTRGKMMIPPSAIDYSCDDEAEDRYYFIYYHYI